MPGNDRSSVDRVKESLNRFAETGDFHHVQSAGHTALDATASVASSAAWYWTKFAAKASIRLVGMVIIAIILFAFVYWWTVPVAMVEFPLHFQYRSATEPVQASALVVDNPRFEDQVPASVLTRGAAYDINIQFTLPESPVNRDLGMFLTSVHLQSANGTAIATSARSSMLRYRSTMISLLRTAVYWIPFTFEWWSESQVIDVNFFRGFVDHGIPEPVSRIFVSINKHPELYDAKVRISAEMNFFQQMASRWFYSTAFVFIIVVSVAEVLVVLSVAGLLFVKAFIAGGGGGGYERSAESMRASLYDRRPGEYRQGRGPRARSLSEDRPRHHRRRSPSDSSVLSDLHDIGDVNATVDGLSPVIKRESVDGDGVRRRNPTTPVQ